MDTKKLDPKHSAEVAAGTTLALGTPAVSRIELGMQQRKLGRIENRREGIRREMGAKGTPPAARTQLNGQYTGRSAGQKLERTVRLKRLQGELNGLNRARKVAEKPRLFNNQTKLWAAGLATGVPLAWHGARNHNAVEKRVTQRDVDAGTVGAVGGLVGYQGGSLALKPLEKPAERKIKDSPTLRGILNEHREKTLPHNAPAGHPAWREYNKTYPRQLPGARMKRANARLVSGRSGGLLTLAAMGAGGTAAVKYERSRHKDVSKSAFGVSHG